MREADLNSFFEHDIRNTKNDDNFEAFLLWIKINKNPELYVSPDLCLNYVGAMQERTVL